MFDLLYLFEENFVRTFNAYYKKNIAVESFSGIIEIHKFNLSVLCYNYGLLVESPFFDSYWLSWEVVEEKGLGLALWQLLRRHFERLSPLQQLSFAISNFSEFKVGKGRLQVECYSSEVPRICLVLNMAQVFDKKVLKLYFPEEVYETLKVEDIKRFLMIIKALKLEDLFEAPNELFLSNIACHFSLMVKSYDEIEMELNSERVFLHTSYSGDFLLLREDGSICERNIAEKLYKIYSVLRRI